MSTKEDLKIPLYSEDLIRTKLPKMFRKVDFSSPSSEGVQLPDKELYFRLGQQSVVERLTELLNKQIQHQGDVNV